MTTGPGRIPPRLHLSPLAKARLVEGAQGKKEVSLEIDGKSQQISAKVLSKNIVKRVWQKLKRSPKKYVQMKIEDIDGHRSNILVKISDLKAKIGSKWKQKIKQTPEPAHALLKGKEKKIAKIQKEIRKIKKLARQNLKEWTTRAEKEGGAIHVTKGESGRKYGFTVTEGGDIHLHSRIFIGQGGAKKVTFAVNINTLALSARGRAEDESKSESIETEVKFFEAFRGNSNILQGHTVTEYGEGKKAILMPLCLGNLDPIDKKGNFKSPLKRPIRGLAQAAEALATVHMNEWVNNDIKDENFMINMDGDVVLGDPGESQNIRANIEEAIKALDQIEKIDQEIDETTVHYEALASELKAVQEMPNPEEEVISDLLAEVKSYRKQQRNLKTSKNPHLRTIMEIWFTPQGTNEFNSPEACPGGDNHSTLLSKPKNGKEITQNRKSRTDLRKKLSSLLGNPIEMNKFVEPIIARDTFAFGCMMYTFNAKKKLPPWQDLKTIVEKIHQLAIVDKEYELLKLIDEGAEERSIMRKALESELAAAKALPGIEKETIEGLEKEIQALKNQDFLKGGEDKVLKVHQDLEKLKVLEGLDSLITVKGMLARLKMNDSLEGELSEIKKELSTKLTKKSVAIKGSLEEQENLRKLIEEYAKVPLARRGVEFLEKNLGNIKSTSLRNILKEIIDKDLKIRTNLKNVGTICERKYGIQLTHNYLARRLTRRHQEALGYTEPDRNDRLAHLEWEMLDPDPMKRPQMRNVAKELNQLSQQLESSEL